MKPRRRKTPSRRSGCPIGFALDLLGDRWSLLIIRDIVFTGKRSFGEFLASEEGIATNVLADRLRRLESAGVLRKEPGGNARARPLYHLTEKGIELVPILVDLVVWGARHDPKTAAPQKFVKRVRKEREALLEKIQSALRRSRPAVTPGAR